MNLRTSYKVQWPGYLFPLFLSVFTLNIPNVTFASELDTTNVVEQSLREGVASEDVGACFPVVGNIDSTNDFLLAMLDGLVEAKAAVTIAASADKKFKNKEYSQFIAGYYSARRHLGCGILKIHNYKKSRNDTVAKSVEGLETSFEELRKLYTQDVAFVRAALNNEVDIRPGTLAERYGQNTMAYKNAFEILAAAVVLSTYSCLPDTKENKLATRSKPGRLNLTKSQRDKIRNKISKEFGNLKKPVSYVEHGVLLLKNFLSDNWKFLDESL